MHIVPGHAVQGHAVPGHAAPGLAVLGLASALLAFSGCSGDGPSPATGVSPPRLVRTAEAAPAPPELERTFAGVVRSAERARLSFQVAGRLVERPVEIGSRLRAGALVARLDATDFRLGLERAEAALAEARALARQAEASFARVRDLYSDDNASRGDLEAALAAVEAGRAREVAAERGVDVARRELGYTRLRVDGPSHVVELLADTGEQVAPGQPVVAVADDGGRLEVEWTVPEAWIVHLRPGLEVEVYLPSLGHRLGAQVVDVAVTPPAGGGAYPVVARLAPGDPSTPGTVSPDSSEPGAHSRGPLPGMAAEVGVRLRGSAPRRSVLLPPEAVAGDPAGWYVLVVEPGDGGQGRVRRRAVEVGPLRPGGLEVVSGLGAGETVVSAGVTFLGDGEVVRLLSEDPLAELPSAVSRVGAP